MKKTLCLILAVLLLLAFSGCRKAQNPENLPGGTPIPAEVQNAEWPA